MLINISRFLGVALAASLIGCARTPVVELEAYSQTFAQAHTAGDLLLDEIATIEDVQAQAGTGTEASCPIGAETGYRDCFTVSLALGPEAARRNEIADIKVRRLALDQIAAYNQLLVDLAQGKSAAALNERIDALQALTGSVIGLAGSAVSLPGVAAVEQFVNLAQPLLAKVEGMRASNAAASSILSAEESVRDLIHLLRDDTPAMYSLYLNDYREKLLLTRIELRGAETAAERQRLTKLVANMSDPESSQNGARVFEKSLIAYVKLLDSSEKTLVLLVRAIKDPLQDPIAVAAQFAAQATEMKLLADDFLTQIRVLRNPVS